MLEKLVDPYGRIINYLRLFVTEHCNLNCVYCRSEQQVCRAGVKEEVLTIQECLAIAERSCRTGDDENPFNRRRTPCAPGYTRYYFRHILYGRAYGPLHDNKCRSPAGFYGFEDTAEAGLDRVNSSLDSLDEETYRRITRGGKLYKTLNGIEKALQAGLTPCKNKYVTA